MGAAKKGEEEHAECGALAKAQEVRDKLPVRDVALWAALIAGYALHGLSIGAVEDGKEIHAEVKRKGLFQNDLVLGIALLDMYATCGVLIMAQEVFDELSTRDIVLWIALIAGYTQHRLNTEALSCLDQMPEEKFSPNAVTFPCILKACGSIGEAKNGEDVHLQVRRQGLLQKDIVLATALVDMYGNTGVLTKAQKVFDELLEQNVASWNALIAGYAQVVNVRMAFNLFIKMIEEDIKPNVLRFVVLLNRLYS